MRHSNARRLGQWSRQNLFDGWQVLGAIGLLAGAFVFAMLISHGKPSLPSTGSTIHLLQTFVSHSPAAEPSAEPTVAPSPSPSPSAVAAAPASGLGAAAVVGASRSGGGSTRPAPSRSQPPAPIVPVVTPLPVPTVTAIPTDRPCLYALCPTPSPSP